MKRVCVFCGSGGGVNVKYTEVAKRLGYLLCQEEIALVYGGSKTGLMGDIANAVLSNGGTVIGVLPKVTLHKEAPHEGLTELRVVNTLAERKELMHELSDAFIALPGGVGTVEELLDVFVLSLFGFHTKPCGFLNVNRYYDYLWAFLKNAVTEGFLKAKYLEKITIEEDPEDLLRNFKSFS